MSKFKVGDTLEYYNIFSCTWEACTLMLEDKDKKDTYLVMSEGGEYTFAHDIRKIKERHGKDNSN